MASNLFILISGLTKINQFFDEFVTQTKPQTFAIPFLPFSKSIIMLRIMEFC